MLKKMVEVMEEGEADTSRHPLESPGSPCWAELGHIPVTVLLVPRDPFAGRGIPAPPRLCVLMAPRSRLSYSSKQTLQPHNKRRELVAEGFVQAPR